MNFVCIFFEIGDKMLTLSSMENLIVQCNLQLMMENIFNVWRYCSSNLTLFHVQISFLSARQNLRFKKIA